MKSGYGLKWYKCRLDSPNITDQEVDVLSSSARNAASKYARKVSTESDTTIEKGQVTVLGVVDGDARKESWPKVFVVSTQAQWEASAKEKK